MIIESSIPYRHIIMRLDPQSYQPREVILPEGFAIRGFRPGDEVGWAQIQTSVNEFQAVEQALKYYQEGWLGYGPDKLGQAQVFVQAPTGELVSDAMLRQKAVFPGDPYVPVTRLDWVATKPAFQRKGLSRALLTFLLNRAVETQPEDPIYLPTQPASHAAIRLYWSLGFRMCRSSGINEEEKPDPDALEILKPLYSDGFGQVLEDTMVE